MKINLPSSLYFCNMATRKHCISPDSDMWSCACIREKADTLRVTFQTQAEHMAVHKGKSSQLWLAVPFLLTDRKCQVQVPLPRKGILSSPSDSFLSPSMSPPGCPSCLQALTDTSCLGWLPPQVPMQYPFLLAFLANLQRNGKEGQDLYLIPNSLRGPQATLLGLQSLPSTVSRPLAPPPSLAPPALQWAMQDTATTPKCKENAGCDLAWVWFGKPPPLPSAQGCP